MRKFTLIIAFIAMVSFVFGQSVTKPSFFKGQAKISNSVVKTKLHKHHASKPVNIIWSDNFSTPSNWTLSHASGTTSDWVITNSSMTSNMQLYMGAFTNATGNVAALDAITALINANGVGTVPLIDAYCATTSPINLTGYSAVTLKFDQMYKAFNSDTTYVEFSTDGGTTWPFSVSVNPKTQVVVNTYAADTVEMIVSQYIANQSNVKIRFTFLTTSTSPLYGSGYGWAVDNVELVEPATNALTISSILPSFDDPYGGSSQYYFVEGTYNYFPATCPTRILNAAVISNTGSNTQSNTMLTVNITDPYSSNYSQSSSAISINSGTTNDTLTVGYTITSGTATYTNPFYLNCVSGFNTSNGLADGLTHIVNQTYVMNYVLSSSALTTPTPSMVDSFTFHVGYQGNPYMNGPDLEYTFARNNQNPACDRVSPQSWQGGGTDGDGIYTSFAIWDEGGTGSTPTCVNYMNVFISDACTFDATLHTGSTLTGIIYLWDSNSSAWVQQIATNPYTLTTADTGHFKQLAFLWDGSSEFLSPGLYIVGVEIAYNTDTCWIGEDYTTLQSWGATYWKLAGGTNTTPGPMGNYDNTPMINLTLYSNPLTIKHVNDNNIVNVYPNPTNGMVSITAPENSTIQIYNLLGINVATVEHSSAFNSVDLSNFSDGNYIVKVTNGGKVTTKKLNLVK